MQQNVSAIADYMRSGIKGENEPGRLGVELEHIIVGPHNQPVAYEGEHGVRWLLEQLADELPRKTYGDDGALIGLAGGNRLISLEPAAQFELSAGPYDDALGVRDDFLAFQRKINDIIDPYEYRMLAVGYHPGAKVDDLALIPKDRYRFMDEHFAQFGHYGRCMMRGSASTQVSIDYYSEKDCVRKLRLASALAPIFALMCDNASTFEGEPSPHHMMRTKIWRECDSARCGTIPGVLRKDFTLEDYAEYVLNTPAIFYFDENGEAQPTEKTFGEVYANREMTRADVEHALSLFFNDARCKTYIEIRPADAMPVAFAAAYATLVRGLFYFPESLDALDDLLDNVNIEAVEQAKSNLMADGYDGMIYGMRAADLADKVFDIARSSLPKGEAMLMSPLAQLVAARKTLAMMGAHR